MSLFARSDSLPLNYINKDDEANEAAEQQQRRQLRLNENQNDINNQKSLLYQALFLPDKTPNGTKQTYVTTASNSIISTALVSPPAKRSKDRWTTSRSLSSSTDSLVVNANTSLSNSSDSLPCNSPSISPASGSNTSPHLNTSTDTFGSVSIRVDQQQNIDDLCQDRDNRADSSNPYQEVSQDSSPGNAFQILNNQCYEAAITEGVKHPSSYKHKSKVKHSKSQTSGYTGVQRQHEKNHRHHRRHNRTSCQDERLTVKPESTSSSNFVVPNTPSLLVCRGESPKSTSSGGSSEVPRHSGHKQYRYNQTFSALQQSGLMKTTMKTAELLRRSRGLQQELAKLHRETTLFVECVLNNPQNKHFKEQYEKGKDNENTQTTAIRTVSTKVVS